MSLNSSKQPFLTISVTDPQKAFQSIMTCDNMLEHVHGQMSELLNIILGQASGLDAMAAMAAAAASTTSSIVPTPSVIGLDWRKRQEGQELGLGCLDKEWKKEWEGA